MSGARLILVDGMAVLYRAFFAIRGLTTAGGLPTNAVYGFIRMLKQLRRCWAPSHMAVVFDGGISRERLDLLPEYKANRPPMPEELRQQIACVQEYLDLAGIARLCREGQEADDLIASVAAKSSHEEGELLIGTSDKDLFQLVNARVRIIPVSGSGEAMGAEEVRAKTGVWPRQIVDWLSLVGDSADNIAGVPGVGPKTAARLLDRFDSLETIQRRLNEVESGIVREAIRTHWDRIVRNVRLVKLQTDLECSSRWDVWQVRPADPERLLPFLARMEFHVLEKEMRQQSLFDGM